MSTPNIRPGGFAKQRRSQRIVLTMSIVISGVRSNNAPFSEPTSTLIVNAHGALIQLRERVLIAQPLRIQNLAINEELACSVMDINPGSNGIPEVGIEFHEPCPHFWRVSFPPADWTPRSPEAKRRSTERAASDPPLVKK